MVSAIQSLIGVSTVYIGKKMYSIIIIEKNNVRVIIKKPIELNYLITHGVPLLEYIM